MFCHLIIAKISLFLIFLSRIERDAYSFYNPKRLVYNFSLQLHNNAHAIMEYIIDKFLSCNMFLLSESVDVCLDSLEQLELAVLHSKRDCQIQRAS